MLLEFADFCSGVLLLCVRSLSCCMKTLKHLLHRWVHGQLVDCKVPKSCGFKTGPNNQPSGTTVFNRCNDVFVLICCIFFSPNMVLCIMNNHLQFALWPWAKFDVSSTAGKTENCPGFSLQRDAIQIVWKWPNPSQVNGHQQLLLQDHHWCLSSLLTHTCILICLNK